MKAFLVMNEAGTEGVVFTDRLDAIHAATGVWPTTTHCSTLADTWRENYCEDDEHLDVIEIELPSVLG
jgi:hypothetical protein